MIKLLQGEAKVIENLSVLNEDHYETIAPSNIMFLIAL